ncbi:MAG: fumarate reductase/succinate dehydrogenase flavoprotein subunit, partial [Actinobacteria bacterium]|nr:fumarate reductase/succinate dehydrogenase flavoprotein subunit [Actinomycetota bacterium]
AATLGELGYRVKAFTFHDSPRRAHSIAAQGGINAAKNYTNDGDSVHRLFYDTVKGGDYRSREANVHRLAEVSVNIIDQATAQGVPFARDYGGLLDNRSFGGAQVSRTFYARGQTGQQLLIGAYSALMRQVAAGTVELHSRAELLDVVTKDGQACGIVTRDLVSGEVTPHSAHAVVLATGGYGNVYFLSTNAMMCNVTAAWRAHRKGALFANPCYTQIHPTCIPASDDFQSKLTLMSESLRNDGRIWVPNGKADSRSAADIPETERDYYLERKYPAFGNLVPRDVASRNAKTVVDEGHGVGPLANGVYLDFSAAIARDGLDAISEKYGNLFDMYQRITGENPYQTPMRIYPATHYTMGGLWVDYNLMTNVEGLYAIGEANFSDHGANRLGASALMQGLADGYFVLPYTIGDGLAGQLGNDPVPTSDPVFTQAVAGINDTNRRWLATNGTKSVDHYHRELGRIVWDNIGMARNKAGLQQAVTDIPALKEEYHKNVRVLGSADTLNQSLEKAGRVADFFELAELMARDALQREESCGGHFRDEYQTAEGEAQRDDENFAHVAAWEWNGEGTDPTRHQEELTFDNVALSQRSYK